MKWSNERFSIIRTTMCSMPDLFGVGSCLFLEAARAELHPTERPPTTREVSRRKRRRAMPALRVAGLRTPFIVQAAGEHQRRRYLVQCGSNITVSKSGDIRSYPNASCDGNETKRITYAGTQQSAFHLQSPIIHIGAYFSKSIDRST